MNIFDNMKNMSIDEMVEWLDKNWTTDYAPWIMWWDEYFCQKCKPVIYTSPDWDVDMEYSYCEVNGNCRYFKNLNKIPDNKQIIKMWLESEC